MSENVTWFVMRGESPLARAVEPAIAGIDIPDEVLDWATRHGLSPQDPDVYLLVAPADDVRGVAGAIASREGVVSSLDLTRAENEVMK